MPATLGSHRAWFRAFFAFGEIILCWWDEEISYVASGALVVVDYVNEMCDMRLKSLHVDGVPDHIVELIASRILDLALSLKTSHISS